MNAYEDLSGSQPHHINDCTLVFQDEGQMVICAESKFGKVCPLTNLEGQAQKRKLKIESNDMALKGLGILPMVGIFFTIADYVHTERCTIRIAKVRAEKEFTFKQSFIKSTIPLLLCIVGTLLYVTFFSHPTLGPLILLGMLLGFTGLIWLIITCVKHFSYLSPGSTPEITKAEKDWFWIAGIHPAFLYQLPVFQSIPHANLNLYAMKHQGEDIAIPLKLLASIDTPPPMPVTEIKDREAGNQPKALLVHRKYITLSKSSSFGDRCIFSAAPGSTSFTLRDCIPSGQHKKIRSILGHGFHEDIEVILKIEVFVARHYLNAGGKPKRKLYVDSASPEELVLHGFGQKYLEYASYIYHFDQS